MDGLAMDTVCLNHVWLDDPVCRAPAPSSWSRPIESRAGTTDRDHDLCLRLSVPHDVSALAAFYAQLSAADRYRRFHGAVNGLPDDLLGDWVSSDTSSSDICRRVSLVAEVAGVGRVIGAHALLALDDHPSAAAEIAIAVGPALRRRSIATSMVRGLQQLAASLCLHWLYASVLADNLPAVRLLQRCGFYCAPSQRDPRLLMCEWLVGAPMTGPRAGRFTRLLSRSSTRAVPTQRRFV